MAAELQAFNTLVLTLCYRLDTSIRLREEFKKITCHQSLVVTSFRLPET